MNVHKRCQKNVANNCGIDVKLLSEILAGMGIRPQEPGKRNKKKVSIVFFIFFFPPLSLQTKFVLISHWNLKYHRSFHFQENFFVTSDSHIFSTFSQLVSQNYPQSLAQ